MSLTGRLTAEPPHPISESITNTGPIASRNCATDDGRPGCEQAGPGGQCAYLQASSARPLAGDHWSSGLRGVPEPGVIDHALPVRSGVQRLEPGPAQTAGQPRTGRPDTGGEQLDVLQTGHHQHRANHGRAIATAAQRRVHDIADAPGRGASIVPMTPRRPARPPRPAAGHRCPGPTSATGTARFRPPRGARPAAGRASAPASRTRPASTAWQRR